MCGTDPVFDERRIAGDEEEERMISVRLQRKGRKKAPFYRIVAADSRSPRDGKFIEILGYYHPIYEEPKIRLKEDRILHYVNTGAKVSHTVWHICKRMGLELPEKAIKRRK